MTDTAPTASEAQPINDADAAPPAAAAEVLATEPEPAAEAVSEVPVPADTPVDASPEPVAEKPIVEEPVAEERVAEEPVAEDLAVDAPSEAPKKKTGPVRSVIRRPGRPRKQVSDDTLDAWQAALERDRAKKAREEQAAVVRRERTETFRRIRAVLQAVNEAPAAPETALPSDALAQRVHEAPAHVRRMIAATLDLLVGKRARRDRPAR